MRDEKSAAGEVGNNVAEMGFRIDFLHPSSFIFQTLHPGTFDLRRSFSLRDC